MIVAECRVDEAMGYEFAIVTEVIGGVVLVDYGVELFYVVEVRGFVIEGDEEVFYVG